MKNTTAKGAIAFEHVSKRYRLGTFGTLRGALNSWLSEGRGANVERSVLWALRDVSFQLTPGASLGLIGPNGSGKTTTLKLLSKVTYPTAGEITVGGRASSLIELGAGFHPELTGRENIYLNGAILGLTQREIKRKLDSIIAFSELERFIDTPVKRYSSGMYVRLGFAVAAHTEPDVLLVDEVLAVGDASFRHRCIQRMHELRRNGVTIIFVSHNMHLVREVCDLALLLVNGEIVASGEPSLVIAEYERALLSVRASEAPSPEQGQVSLESQDSLFLTAVEVLSPNLNANAVLASHLPAKVKISYRAVSPQPIGRVDVRIIREDGTLCSTADSSQATDSNQRLEKVSGDGVIEVVYEPLQLTTGRYFVLVQITDPSDSFVIASGQSELFDAHAEGSDLGRGVYIPQVSWANLCLGAQRESGLGG